MDVLTTDRLRLRRLTLADTDDLLEVLGDPVAMAYYPAAKDREGVAAWIRWASDSYQEDGFGLWAIERTTDGAFLGDCGPMLQPVEEDWLPEIGYHLIRREWGHGYATEAAQACLAWLFRRDRLRPRLLHRLSREPAFSSGRRARPSAARDDHVGAHGHATMRVLDDPRAARRALDRGP